MERKAPKSLTPYGPFAAFSLLECGGLDPILPCLGGRSDAALLGRALAPLGIAPTENIMSNPVMVRHVMPF